MNFWLKKIQLFIFCIKNGCTKGRWKMNIAKLRSEINLHQTVSKLEQRWDNDGISLIILSERVLEGKGSEKRVSKVGQRVEI